LDPRKEPVQVKQEPGTSRANTSAANDEEDWEAETDGYKSAYDPRQKIEQIPIYQPPNMTRSERRDHRLQKKLEHQEKVFNDLNATALNGGVFVKKEEPDEFTYEQKPVVKREPQQQPCSSAGSKQQAGHFDWEP